MTCGESIDKCEKFEEELRDDAMLNFENTDCCTFQHIGQLDNRSISQELILG